MNIHLKSAWNNIIRSPFQALSAVFVLSITFFVISTLATLVYSSSNVLKYFETRPQIIVFLNDRADDESVSVLKNKLQNDSRVKEVKYVSKEDALEIYKKATSDNPLLSELVNPSIFPASLEVSVSNLSHASSLISEVEKEEITDQVGFTASLGGEEALGDVVERLRRIALYLKLGGGIFAGILAGTSFLVLIVIIGMRMNTRRGEIEILNLIGATPGFVQSPIFLEAIFYTTVGVFMGWILSFILVLYATPSIVDYFGEIPILPKETLNLLGLFGLFLAVELFVGLVLAASGCALALSRIKRK